MTVHSLKTLDGYPDHLVGRSPGSLENTNHVKDILMLRVFPEGKPMVGMELVSHLEAELTSRKRP